jgi:hypothetical protein
VDEQQPATNHRIDPGRCELCDRQRRLTYHHLIPRTVHGNKWFKKRFGRAEMARGINICWACHSYLHKHFSEKELARNLNTKEALLENEIVRRRVEWVRKRR